MRSQAKVRTFTDSAAREWSIELTYRTVQRVHKDTGVNLRDLVDLKNPLEPCFDFLADPTRFGPALCAIVQPQLDQRDVTAEAFLESLDGDAAFAAAIAFARAFIDLYHHDLKDALQKLIDKVQEAELCARK